MTKAVVFAGGTVSDYTMLPVRIDDADCIICADSGIVHCSLMRLKADVWVGDFDSSDFEEFSKLNAAKNAEIIRLNPMKDDTDTEFALDIAANRGYKEIVLIGGVGTRLDHSLANIFLMEKYFKLGVKLTIVNEHNIFNLSCNSTVTLRRNRMKYVSLLPLETVKVTNSGFLYPLKDEFLYRYSSRGISNEITEEYGSITTSGGCAIIIESVD